MRGHVKRRCPAPKPGQPQCPGKTCAHPYAFWIDQPRSEDGKRRQITRSGFRTKKEAERALAKALTEVEDGSFTRPDTTTVAVHLRTWLAGLDRKPATLDAYRRVVDAHLVPALGRLRIQHLTPPHIKAAYRALQDEKGLSPTTVQLVHQVLSKALSDAVTTACLQPTRLQRSKRRPAAPLRCTRGRDNRRHGSCGTSTESGSLRCGACSSPPACAAERSRRCAGRMWISTERPCRCAKQGT